MEKYLYSISETKNRLTLQNVQMLIGYELLSEEVSFQIKVFNFNKYIKKNKNLKNYTLDRAAYNFYEKHFDIDLLIFENFSENIIAAIDQKVWEKIYQKEMNIMRDYIKKNEKELLSKLNFILTDNLRTKYAQGNLSKWEMDSVSFYYHEHELSKIQRDIYEISNFFTLDEEPVEEYTFQTQTGYNVSIYQLCRIAGTVLDKDKEKHIVNILTPDGVVTIKIWDSQFSKYDKQISELQKTERKKLLKKSWFSRGNKLIFTGN